MEQHTLRKLLCKQTLAIMVCWKRSWNSEGNAYSMFLQTLDLISCLLKVAKLSFSTSSFVLSFFVFTKLLTQTLMSLSGLIEKQSELWKNKNKRRSRKHTLSAGKVHQDAAHTWLLSPGAGQSFLVNSSI